jgi:hypothetical protein
VKPHPTRTTRCFTHGFGVDGHHFAYIFDGSDNAVALRFWRDRGVDNGVQLMVADLDVTGMPVDIDVTIGSGEDRAGMLKLMSEAMSRCFDEMRWNSPHRKVLRSLFHHFREMADEAAATRVD